MKTRLNYYECKFGYKGQPHAGTLITYKEDGGVSVKTNPYHCPVCGSKELDLKSEVTNQHNILNHFE